MEKDPVHANKGNSAQILPSMQIDGRLLLNERQASNAVSVRLQRDIERTRKQCRAGGLLGLLTAGLAFLVMFLHLQNETLDGTWYVLALMASVLSVSAWFLSGRLLLARSSLVYWRASLLLVGLVGVIAWCLMVGHLWLEPPWQHRLESLVLAFTAAFLWLSMTAYWLPGLLTGWSLFAAGLAWQFTEAPVPPSHLPALILIGLLLLGFSLFLAVIAREFASLTLAERKSRRDYSKLKTDLYNQQEILLSGEAERHKMEQALAEAYEVADVANIAKTEFLATMSHEIRTPLNGILPILEILKDTPLNQEQLQHVTTAYNSSRHLLRIINDVLDFAKAESGKLELENIEIDLRELVDSVAQLMGKSAEQRDLKLVAEVAENVPLSVRGDPIRLRQILTNLVNNAIKFTEKGEIQVEVKMRRSSRKEVELLFSVTDTGIGMDRDTLRRLFRSFSQADASTTRKHGGTGLGLAICKRLVELMGGRIGVRSQPGTGSTFWFSLLMRKSAGDVPAARKNLEGVRLLTLVDDEREAKQVSGYLRQWGIQEERAGSLVEALNALESMSGLGGNSIYDLVLVCTSNNKRSGMAFVQEVRSHPSLQDIQLLLVTDLTIADKTLATMPGVYLMRGPLQPQVMKRQLERLLDVEGMPRQERPEVDPVKTLDDLASEQSISYVNPKGSETTKAPATGGRVLLVEDNPVNLNVVRKLLSRLGLDCQAAHDGQEALEMLDQAHFDLVIMDCQMPVMDGYEATRRLREQEQEHSHPRMPVVAITANAMSDDRAKCLRAGMDDYLAKPVSLEQLRTTLQRWLPGVLADATQRSPAPSSGQSLSAKPAEVIDLSLFEELREVMEEDLNGLIRSYLDSAPKLLTQLREAIGDQDVKAMILPAHSLKSSSANMGAMRLSEAARQVELAAREGDFKTASEVAVHLDDEFSSASGELERLLAA